MDVLHIGDTQPIQVDVCFEHGVWLDKGELTQILFVDRKGRPQKKRVIQKKMTRTLDSLFDDIEEKYENHIQTLKEL